MLSGMRNSNSKCTKILIVILSNDGHKESVWFLGFTTCSTPSLPLRPHQVYERVDRKERGMGLQLADELFIHLFEQLPALGLQGLGFRIVPLK